MQIFTTVADWQQFLRAQRGNKPHQNAAHSTIGFVPTMGALHAGHISLLERARVECNIVACSIFVNPTQFNDPADLLKYPRPIAADIAMLEQSGCDALLLPSVAEIYPDGTVWRNPFQFGALTKVLEGAFRPGHFDGMVQVVSRLLQIVQPEAIYMGQKDFQQQSIVAEMLRQQKSSVCLVCCPIVREPSGLAMSSRNVRLSNGARSEAAAIHNALQAAASDYSDGVLAQSLQHNIQVKINENPLFSTDYIAVVDGDTLLPITEFKAHRQAVVCVAIRVEGVRLLDNIILF